MSKKPTDESRIASLASILHASNKVKDVPAPTTPPPSPAPPSPPAEAAPEPRKRGEVGKSKDPKYRFTGVYIRKETLKLSRRRLEDLETGQDFSELVEMLLNQWLAATK